MRKFVFIILTLTFAIYLTGCGKKQPDLEELQIPMSMETPSATPAPETKARSGAKIQVLPAAPVVEQAKLEPLPPPGPYKPTAIEIQTALKNAGFYTGNIDGKIGPQTKKAIEEFQESNGLQADGKVGLKTWAALGTYLNPVVEAKPKKK
jgi:peptidoglycan hydrolase-like protein with peptidoglycan-binding domain